MLFLLTLLRYFVIDEKENIDEKKILENSWKY